MKKLAALAASALVLVGCGQGGDNGMGGGAGPETDQSTGASRGSSKQEGTGQGDPQPGISSGQRQSGTDSAITSQSSPGGASGQADTNQVGATGARNANSGTP